MTQATSSDSGDSEIPTVEGWWTSVNTPDLQQGDLFNGVYLPLPPAETGETQTTTTPEKQDLIVLSHSCDLLNKKLRVVTCASVSSFSIAAKKYSIADFNDIKKRRREGLMLLRAPNYQSENDVLLVDFRELHGIALGTLTGLTKDDRFRLKSPYLEHFSQTFGGYIMRVGLPVALKDLTSPPASQTTMGT